MLSIIVKSPPPPQVYRRWLRRQLGYTCVDHNHLVAMLILLERVVYNEQIALTRRMVQPPFYRLDAKKGESRAWYYAAEGALWLDHKNYPPWEWFTALCAWSPIRRRLIFGEQIPLSMFMPSTRLGAQHIREREQFYLSWKRWH